VMFLYRDEVYNEESTAQGVAEVICAKFRNGEIGKDYLTANLAQCRFDDFAGSLPASQPQQYTKRYRGGMDF